MVFSTSMVEMVSPPEIDDVLLPVADLDGAVGGHNRDAVAIGDIAAGDCCACSHSWLPAGSRSAG